MNEFFNGLVENKKQKIAGIIYIILLFVNWTEVNVHNGEILGTCSTSGHDCYSLATTSLIITAIFLVILLLLKKKE